MHNRKYLISNLIAVLCVTALLLVVFLPAGQERLQQSVCRVRTTATYALSIGGTDTLYLPIVDEDQIIASLSPDSVAHVTELTGSFVSGLGHVLTSDSAVAHCPDTLTASETLSRLHRADSILSAQKKNFEDVLGALDEYAETHSVVDDGYNDVMTFRALTDSRLQQTDSVLQRLQSIETQNSAPRAVLRVCADVLFTETDDSLRSCTDTLQAEAVARDTNGLMLFRLSQGRLPHGASRFSVYRFGLARHDKRVCGFADYGGVTSRPFPDFASTDSILPRSAMEGAVRLNPVGRLDGIVVGERICTARSIANFLAQQHTWPVWWWQNLCSWVKRIFASDSMVNKHFQRHTASLCIAQTDGQRCEVYQGQATPDASGRLVRCGYGQQTDSAGTRYEGQWMADTLIAGSRQDSLGFYKGTFNAALQPQGQGVFIGKNGEFYAGNWKDGKRHGHGFSVNGRHIVRCGDWKKGSFRGERMIYTSDRVYGIDISRYQHESGRKRYTIDWNKLRITGLGSGRRVSGTADYPVSFIYIKATQGTTLFSKYYLADIRQARCHGIAAGSYHFYSPKRNGSSQAAWFLKKASIAKTDLPPVLDLEPTEKQIREMGGDEAMFREALIWLRIVENKCGKKPLLYVSQQFVNDHLSKAPEAFRRYDVWVARYGEFKPYVKLLHWQLTPYGKVRGIHGEVDINVFNGTREKFRSYISSN